MADAEKIHPTRRPNAKIILVLLLALSLIANGALVMKLNEKRPESVKFRLIDPIAAEPTDAKDGDSEAILHYMGLREKLESRIKNATQVENVGVFVQDAQTGAWLGINERENFFPASLLKIPVMMVILKKTGRGEMMLNDTVTIVESDLETGSGALFNTGMGKSFTVWELIKEMILSSDNTAKNALKRFISQAELNSVFAHVGIENPYYNTSAGVTPRGFTRFFKALYFSTFLKPELSEKALDLTTDTEEEGLIPAELPPEIQVAHKYGKTPDGFHDCGIVYHPRNPYFLCIMTKDMDYSAGRQLIVGISRDVFEFVDSK